MKLKAFMKVLREAAVYTKKKEQTEDATMGTVCSHSYGDGIQCQLHLTADGDVSAEQTGITISFTVPSAK